MRDRLALDVRAVSKSYRGRVVVRALDLQVHRGEVHALLGPNGAGKTTLFRMLGGLVAPDAGTMSVLDGTPGTVASAARGGIAGFVDAPKFYPYLSGRANLMLLARLDGADGAPERVDQALADVDLAGRATLRVGGYSAGMRQRLGLAAVLLREPALVFLDEPTNTLDPAGARAVRDRIRRLAEEGAAVLFSSHEMSEVESLASTVTVLQHGAVAFSGTLAELRERAPPAHRRLSTSDDGRALALAGGHPHVEVAASPDGAGLDVGGDEAALDGYVLALGAAGIAVRALSTRDASLESLFLRLTVDAAPPAAISSARRSSDRARLRAAGVARVIRAEMAKLAAQAKVWVMAAICALGPFVFVATLNAQAALPEDTLFGRWVKQSGFAVPLFVLGFAPAFVLPLLTSLVAGDLFASEDRYGTWPTLLLRSRTRAEVFAGKTVTAVLFACASVAVLALSSTAAGVLLVGRQPLLGLAGLDIAPSRALALVLLAWSSALPPTMGFTGLAVLASTTSRNSAAGMGLPVLVALGMSLTSVVAFPEPIRRGMLTTPFDAWHGLFVDPLLTAPLVEGAVLSAAYFTVSVTVAWLVFARRDIGP